jgi:hypothetical protein
MPSLVGEMGGCSTQARAARRSRETFPDIVRSSLDNTGYGLPEGFAAA